MEFFARHSLVMGSFADSDSGSSCGSDSDEDSVQLQESSKM